MSRAIASWPIPQNRPGAAADGCDCFVISGPDPMSTAIGDGPVPQNWPWRTSREVRLHTLKWWIPASFRPDGRKPSLIRQVVGDRAPIDNCERGKPKV